MRINSEFKFNYELNCSEHQKRRSRHSVSLLEAVPAQMGQPHHHTIQGLCFSCLADLAAHPQPTKNVSASAPSGGRKKWQRGKMTSSWGILTFTMGEKVPKGLSPTACQQLCPTAMPCSHGAGAFSGVFPTSPMEEGRGMVAGNSC